MNGFTHNPYPTHWVTCLLIMKFLTYALSLTISTALSCLYRLSHVVLVTLSCSPSACPTVTDVQSPLPSHKHCFTPSTSFWHSILITHSVFVFFCHPATISHIDTTSSLWLQLPLSQYMASQMYTCKHSLPEFSLFLTPGYPICSLYSFWHTPLCSLPHDQSHTLMAFHTESCLCTQLFPTASGKKMLPASSITFKNIYLQEQFPILWDS